MVLRRLRWCIRRLLAASVPPSVFFPIWELASFLQYPSLSSAGVIWCAHIGFDHVLGYGLKYSAGFRFTHLGSISRSIVPTPAA
ncbi:DUF4260 family protein [Sulfuriferula plumbiphila]|uniref:DUF4260 family protein n=1 Tax=Sulfuriferula plumbiphila TaxID=171865 RepID=UPI0011BF85FC